MSELPSLETKLREVVEAGELTHLSIVPKAGDGPGGVVWSASVSPSMWGSFFATDADPCKALVLALEQIKLKKKKAPTSDAFEKEFG